MSLSQTEERPLPESHKKVLLGIAKKGPQTKYKIEKETKVNHASTHEAVKNLLNMGMLEGEEVGTTRVGLPKTEYKLTFFGFYMALKNADGEDYGQIIKKWRYLEPLLLGKWDYFVQKVGKEQTKNFLLLNDYFVKKGWRKSSDYFLFCGSKTIIARSSKLEEIIEAFRKNLVSDLFEWFSRPVYIDEESFWDAEEYEQAWGEKPRQTFEKWIDAFNGDPQLRKYDEEYISDRLDAARLEIEWAQFLRRKISKHS